MGSKSSSHYEQHPTPASYKYEHFNRPHQALRLLRTSLLKWFLTLCLGVSIFAVLWTYSDKDAMPQRQKRIFSVIMVGLTLGLSLNIATSLQNIVSELRWWLLGLRRYTPREVGWVFLSPYL
jgi:hypothetical protein